jgi:hypothetical protein
MRRTKPNFPSSATIISIRGLPETGKNKCYLLILHYQHAQIMLRQHRCMMLPTHRFPLALTSMCDSKCLYVQVAQQFAQYLYAWPS